MGRLISEKYAAWQAECEERFQQLKKNEEELNRIFIDIYGLQDELTPDVADKDVTVHRVFTSRDDVPESMKGSSYVRTMRDEIVSLISYAVGCMFGRYSLDVDGLAYAGGEWDASKYKTIIPDSDNIIPICDDEYFDDDITGRFVEFVRKVYGDDTLEENLKFIADALGGKGMYELCRTVENELQLPTRFDKFEPETLITGDVFPCINESILKQLFAEISDHVVKVDLIRKVCENRRTAGWYKRFSDYFDCLFFIGKMQTFYQEHGGGFHIVEPKKIWKLYTSDLYRMDAYYRHFHYAFGNSLKNANDVLEDSLKHSTEFVEALYQNWFLRELTSCWTNAAAEDLASLGYVSEIEKQRDFYKRYVVPASSKNTRAFVIISDALRYEVASELSERIVRTTKGTAELESMQAIFPSITKFGMAALLPGRSISVNDSMDVLVDGNPTRSTVERNTILNATPKASVAIQYNDLLNMKKDERRELVAGKDVIYIYHNSIDAIGDKAPTESKVFDACETAIQELSGILRIIVNELSGTNIFITADHGFLYTYKPLSESDKIDRKAFSGNVYELGRRYALTAPDTTADFLLPVNLERELDGAPIKGYAPQDTIRMKVQGGGENYVHGGISLQELVVPVIAFKNLRTSNKNYVEVKNAELKLLSESRKISNLIFSLEFHQRQPVGDKIQPCTYSIYMTDDEGVVISDRQTVIADKTSDNAADRVFRVRFNLKAGTYDKKKVYRLVIANEIDVEEIEFHIDIAFADDFGFDL